MIKKLNNYFFDLEEGETIGIEGSLFYFSTFGGLTVAVLLKLITL